MIDIRKELDQSASKNKKSDRRKAAAKEEPLMPLDDQYNLPIGTEFDYILKSKQRENDSKKQLNDMKMDELVAKLGYMDYRDALACNKYIIEAKRSGEYHQVARARILEVAFN